MTATVIKVRRGAGERVGVEKLVYGCYIRQKRGKKYSFNNMKREPLPEGERKKIEEREPGREGRKEGRRGIGGRITIKNNNKRERRLKGKEEWG